MTGPHPAVLAFDVVAREIITARGEDPTRRRIAALVGEAETNYGGALAGRGGSLDRVQRWIVAWTAAGMPPLELRTDAGGVEVRLRHH